MDAPVLSESILKEWRVSNIAPSLAFLGPRGAGKTAILHSMAAEFRARSGSELQPLPFYLDLRKVPLESEPRMYGALNQLIATVGSLRRQSSSNPQSEFDHLLSESTNGGKRAIIFMFDHLDSIPRFFARSLARSLRAFRENTSHESPARLLGLAVAGTISLYELKREVDSPFSYFKVFKVPAQITAPLTWISSYSSSVQEAIIQETAGEESFAQALRHEIAYQNSKPSTELIRESADRLCSRSDLLPPLRDIALALWQDRKVYELCLDLIARGEIRPSQPVVDIHSFELAGVAVLDSNEFFRFRNGIVHRFVRKLLEEMSRVNYYHSAGILSQRHASQIAAFPVLGDLLRLVSAKSSFVSAKTMADIFEGLSVAWTVTTRQDKASFRFWLKDKDRIFRMPQPSERMDGTAESEAFEMSFKSKRPSFSADDSVITYAYPISSEPQISLVTNMSRSEFDGDCSEVSLAHWSQFIEWAKPLLAMFVRAQLSDLLLESKDKSSAVNVSAGNADSGHDQVWIFESRGAAYSNSDRTQFFQGSISARTIDDLDRRTHSLWKQKGEDFEGTLRGIGEQLSSALTSFGELVTLVNLHYKSKLSIISSIEGLKLPLELFLVGDSYLSLQRPVSRKIAGAYPTHFWTTQSRVPTIQDVSTVFSAVIVAADEQLAGTMEEADAVRRTIEVCCARSSRSCSIHVLKGEAANGRNLGDLLKNLGLVHILHFCGHSQLDKQQPDDSGILLHGDDGRMAVVTLRMLRQILDDTKVWFAYLSSCEGSGVAGSHQMLSQRYLGLVEALLASGIPNVLGFRCRVSDQSAYLFASTVYRHLFDEFDLTRSVYTARRKVDASELRDAAASSVLVQQF